MQNLLFSTNWVLVVNDTFSFQFLNVGVVASIESNHKAVDVARKPQEVCIKIEVTQGEAPKMVGRHFDENDVLTSKVRVSIDLL